MTPEAAMPTIRCADELRGFSDPLKRDGLYTTEAARLIADRGRELAVRK